MAAGNYVGGHCEEVYNIKATQLIIDIKKIFMNCCLKAKIIEGNNSR